MIGYVTFGTNDIKRAAAFYDQLLAEIGAKRIMEEETFIVWGNSPTQATALSVTKPFDGKAATVGNGVMVALVVKEPAQVDKLYKKALELGAQRRRSRRAARPGLLRRLLPRPRRQQAQRLLHDLDLQHQLAEVLALEQLQQRLRKRLQAATMSSRVLSLPAASQPAISRIASGIAARVVEHEHAGHARAVHEQRHVVRRSAHAGRAVVLRSRRKSRCAHCARSASARCRESRRRRCRSTRRRLADNAGAASASRRPTCSRLRRRSRARARGSRTSRGRRRCRPRDIL